MGENALNTLGLFSQPSYLGIGDEYGRRTTSDQRHGGKQFLTTPLKKGQTADNWGPGPRHFSGLYSGDRYEDPGTLEKKERLSRKKKFLTPSGFRPSSPPKKATGLGTYDGCIGPVVEHIPDAPSKPAKAGKGPAPRQIQTSPPRKGHFGSTGITIGKEPEYMADPYEGWKIKEAEERKQHLRKRVAGPFKTMSHPLDYFDSQPNVAAPKVYSQDRPLPSGSRSNRLSRSQPEIKVPFRPSSVPRKGYNATLAPFPDYAEDPYNTRTARERNAKHNERANMKGAAWRPTSTPKSVRTPSIISKALYLGDNTWSHSI